MFEVSEKASEVMKQLLEGREGTRSLRCLMTEGGWKGPSLVMGLDEQREDDHIFTEKGLTFIVDKPLLGRVKPIKIDYTEGALGSGFTLQSELTKAAPHEPQKCESLCEHC